jgi:enterochelin esterase-like enzyme
MSYFLRQQCVLIGCLFFAGAAIADEGILSENQRIFSQQLGYELQYRVYRPASATAEANLPSLYVTDGPGYLAQGNFKSVLDTAIANGEIKPVIVVFNARISPGRHL